jgi:hypothetical protein
MYYMIYNINNGKVIFAKLSYIIKHLSIINVVLAC